MALPGSPKKRSRRSYNCGPCKKHKIKCDMQTPCGNCTRYHREQACRDCPPNPPTKEQMVKKKERRKKYFEKKTRELFKQHSVGIVHDTGSINGSNVPSHNNNNCMQHSLQQNQITPMDLPSIIHQSPFHVARVSAAYAEPQRSQVEQQHVQSAKHTHNLDNISSNDDHNNNSINIHDQPHYIPYQHLPPYQQMVTQQNLSMLDNANESQRIYLPLEVQQHAPPIVSTTFANSNSIHWNLKSFAKGRVSQDPNFDINGSDITLVNHNNDQINDNIHHNDAQNTNNDNKDNLNSGSPIFSKYNANMQQTVAPRYSDQLQHYPSNVPLRGGSDMLPALGNMPVHNNVPMSNPISMPSMQANVGFQQPNGVDYESKSFTQHNHQHPQLLDNASMNASSNSSATIVSSNHAPVYAPYTQNQNLLLNAYESTSPKQ